MYKKNYFKSLLLLAMMLIGAGNLWADDVPAYTLTPATGSNNNYASNCDITISGITWNLTGNSQLIPWRIGGKSLDGADRTLYSKTAISDNISKIEVTHGAASSITVNSWTVLVSKNSDFSNPVSTLTPTFAPNATTTITRPDGVDWSNCYFKFVYNVTVSGDKNKFIEFSEAKFYKESGGNTRCATPTFSPAAGTYTSSQSVTISTETEDATIYYTTDGAAPTTESTEYTTAITVDQTMTIKAIAVKDGLNNSAVATAIYTIVPDYATLPFEYDGNGTGDLPQGFTVSGLGTYNSSPAMKFDGTGDYAILKFNERPGKLTFDIKGNPSNGVWSGTFTVQTSEDGTTYTDLETYTELGSSKESKELNNLGENVRYIKWIYTEKVSGNVALGNIKLEKYSDVVVPEEGDNYELFSGELVEGDYLIVYDGKAMNTTVESERLQYTEVKPINDVITTDDATIIWHIAKSGEYWTIYNAAADAYAASTGAKNKAQMLTDGTDDKALWTVSASEGTYDFVNKQNTTNEVNATLRKNGTYGFACYSTGTGGALSLYKKVEATPEYVTVSISSAGLATFCSENALDFTGIEEVYAYKVSVNEKQISYTRVYQVPAETGVVLRSLSGDAISVEVPVIESADEIADNALVAVLEAIESLPTDGDGCTNYILNNLPSNGVGFYKANNQPVGAGKAYLQVEGTLSKDFIGFADGVATGIETIDNGWTVDNEIYDLQGRKVMNPTKGIFIQNGRKVVIK